MTDPGCLCGVSCSRVVDVNVSATLENFERGVLLSYPSVRTRQLHSSLRVSCGLTLAQHRVVTPNIDKRPPLPTSAAMVRPAGVDAVRLKIRRQFRQ